MGKSITVDKSKSFAIRIVNLLHNTGYLSNKQYESINNDCIELVRLLTATAKTLNEKIEEA